MPQELRLAELLATRLCHDLTGPIGAVNNGAEFLEEGEEGMMEDALGLIASSAREAVSRVQFFRQAYGYIKASGEASLSELKALSEQYFASTKIILDWPDTSTDASGVSVSRRMGRLMLNMTIIASETLIRGGTLRVSVTRDGDAALVTLVAQGTGARFEPEAKQVLDGMVAVSDLTPKTVQVFLTHCLAADLGAQLHADLDEETFTISARKAA